MTENEYAQKIIPLLLGGMSPGKVKRLQVIAEVPKYSNINHMDLLMIDRKYKKMIAIEFKLKNPKDLMIQVDRNIYGIGISCIGIINQAKTKQKIHDKDNNIYFLKIPGLEKCDETIDRLCQHINASYRWTDITCFNRGMLYWYGYMNYKQLDIENVGMGTCERLSFFQLYKMAIKNIMDARLDYDMIHSFFGVYGRSTVKKYYDEVVREV